MMLRRVLETDLPTFFAHQQDPEATAMAGFPARDWDAFVAHWRQNVLADGNGELLFQIPSSVVGR